MANSGHISCSILRKKIIQPLRLYAKPNILEVGPQGPKGTSSWYNICSLLPVLSIFYEFLYYYVAKHDAKMLVEYALFLE